MFKRLIFLSVLLLLTINACFDRQVKVEESEIIGVYLSNEETCLDSLEIRPNNIYVQYYVGVDDTLDSNVSTWQLYYFFAEQIMDFSEYTMILPNCKARKDGGLSTHFFRSPSGKLKILIDPCYGRYYIKQEQ